METDEEYIAEDQDIESSRTRKAAQCIQQNILQELWTVVGEAQALPETVAQDLILQVYMVYSILINY